MSTLKPSGMDEQLAKDILTISSVFIGSSLAGWAYLIWEDKPITTRQKIAGTILSGSAGCIVALILWDVMAERRAPLIGISLLAGIGGASTLEWLTAIVRKKVTKVLQRGGERVE